ncbi:MAG: hypothetical protein U9N09_09340 [Euryarchaeota archaeon]|nr:hypothetical protein [Euryarchaeota archaeon]
MEKMQIDADSRVFLAEILLKVRVSSRASTDPDAEKKMKEINEAHDVLSDPG